MATKKNPNIFRTKKEDIKRRRSSQPILHLHSHRVRGVMGLKFCCCSFCLMSSRFTSKCLSHNICFSFLLFTHKRTIMVSSICVFFPVSVMLFTEHYRVLMLGLCQLDNNKNYTQNALNHKWNMQSSFHSILCMVYGTCNMHNDSIDKILKTLAFFVGMRFGCWQTRARPRFFLHKEKRFRAMKL